MGFGFCQKGWAQPPGAGREGGGDGLGHSGALSKGAEEHLPPKSACPWGQSAVLPIATLYWRAPQARFLGGSSDWNDRQGF